MIAEDFLALFGGAPDGVWQAPGRVNLIGEHVDYNDGFVLPFAIDRRAQVAVAARTDRAVRVSSRQQRGVVETGIDVASLDGWAGYVVGVAWALRQQGIDMPGFDLLVDSAVPSGSGLSSSAALETATALALTHLADVCLPELDLALACHRAETGFVGAPVGVMDQVASACAIDGHALLLDCRSLDLRHIPLDVPGCALMVVDTGVRHRNTSGAYAERRSSCEQAASLLGVKTLRDADLSAMHDLPERLRPRARHVVSEIRRVEQAVVALETKNVTGLGALLLASHASLRDDFEVSCLELDLVVDTAMALGALGARLTGAGFGGCALALVPHGAVDPVMRALDAAFAAAGLADPQTFTVRPVGGATRVA